MISWIEDRHLPFGRGGTATGFVDRQFIVAGGSHWIDGVKRLLDEVTAYDIERKEWRQLNPLPRALMGAAGATWGDSFFVVGGAGANFTSDLVYRMSAGSWNEFRHLPAPVSHGAALVAGTHLLVLGGVRDSQRFVDYRSEVFALDLTCPETDWLSLPPIPGPGRALFAAALLRGRVYVFGGCTDGAINLGDAWVFDLLTGSWRELSGLTSPTRAWSAVPWRDRYIFLLGGYSTKFEPRVICYDAELDVYQEASSLPLALADIAFQAYGDSFYGAGGEPGPKARSAVLWIGRVEWNTRE